MSLIKRVTTTTRMVDSKDRMDGEIYERKVKLFGVTISSTISIFNAESSTKNLSETPKVGFAK